MIRNKYPEMGGRGEEAQAHAGLSNQGREGHEVAFAPQPYSPLRGR